MNELEEILETIQKDCEMSRETREKHLLATDMPQNLAIHGCHSNVCSQCHV